MEALTSLLILLGLFAAFYIIAEGSQSKKKKPIQKYTEATSNLLHGVADKLSDTVDELTKSKSEKEINEAKAYIKNIIQYIYRYPFSSNKYNPFYNSKINSWNTDIYNYLADYFVDDLKKGFDWDIFIKEFNYYAIIDVYSELSMPLKSSQVQSELKKYNREKNIIEYKNWESSRFNSRVFDILSSYLPTIHIDSKQIDELLFYCLALDINDVFDKNDKDFAKETIRGYLSGKYGYYHMAGSSELIISFANEISTLLNILNKEKVNKDEINILTAKLMIRIFCITDWDNEYTHLVNKEHIQSYINLVNYIKDKRLSKDILNREYDVLYNVISEGESNNFAEDEICQISATYAILHTMNNTSDYSDIIKNDYIKKCIDILPYILKKDYPNSKDIYCWLKYVDCHSEIIIEKYYTSLYRYEIEDYFEKKSNSNFFESRERTLPNDNNYRTRKLFKALDYFNIPVEDYIKYDNVVLKMYNIEERFNDIDIVSKILDKE